ncbi:MAG: hypothetical protein HW420_1363 [Candidatus Nitrosotenuis sp.]|nr:hypothetical protein [Candidatus Nitrosotenuis sp.]
MLRYSILQSIPILKTAAVGLETVLQYSNVQSIVMMLSRYAVSVIWKRENVCSARNASKNTNVVKR